jgi:hypothetical protein
MWYHVATMPERIGIQARIDQLHEASDITPGKSLDRPIRRSPSVGQTNASEALEEDRAER